MLLQEYSVKVIISHISTICVERFDIISFISKMLIVFYSVQTTLGRVKNNFANNWVAIKGVNTNDFVIVIVREEMSDNRPIAIMKFNFFLLH